jgi:flagellar L-ring protein precursor FlgH
VKVILKSSGCWLPRGLARAAVLVVAFSVFATGCHPEIGGYIPPKRAYKSPVSFPEQTERAREGAIWTPTQPGNFMLVDQRAMRVGDLLMVVVREKADAKRGAATEIGRDSSMTNSISDAFALLKLLKPELIGAEMLGGKSGSDFSGSGTTSRSERLEARVAATVRQVLPNGNLFIEGHREILVNREAHHFYISGVVRPSDIRDDNTVDSARMAEAQIVFNGRGVISDTQSPGIVSRVLNKYNPF